MRQVARNLTDPFDGFLRDARYLIHDADPLFTQEFKQILERDGHPGPGPGHLALILARAGVGGLHGDVAVLAADRRRRLVEHAVEVGLGTNPFNPDTDGDGITDLAAASALADDILRQILPR